MQVHNVCVQGSLSVTGVCSVVHVRTSLSYIISCHLMSVYVFLDSISVLCISSY